MALNVRAPFFLAQARGAALRAARGTIVNIADLAAFETWPAYVPHGISKAGVVHMTRALARVLAPEVRVNAVAPGAVLLPEDWTDEDAERLRPTTPLQRTASPTDVAQAVLFFSIPTTSPARRSSSTAAGMSAPERRGRVARDVQRFGTIVVVGGGCYGSYYVRQLASRAPRRRARVGRELVVVDRDAHCRVARSRIRRSARPALEHRDRRLARVLRRAISASAASAPRRRPSATRSSRRRSCRISWRSGSSIAPRRAGRTRRVAVAPLSAAAGGAVAARRRRRHALRELREWMCPINCIEPPRCPAHARRPGPGAMPAAVREYVDRMSALPVAGRGSVRLHCLASRLRRRDVRLSGRRRRRRGGCRRARARRGGAFSSARSRTAMARCTRHRRRALSVR